MVTIIIFLASLLILGIAAWDRMYHSMTGRPTSTDTMLALIIFLIAVALSFIVPALISIFQRDKSSPKEWRVPALGVIASALFPVAINFDLIPIPIVYAWADGIGVFLVYFTAMLLSTYSLKYMLLFKGKLPGKFSLFTILYVVSALTTAAVIGAVIYIE